MVHHEFRDLWTRATAGDVTMAKAAVFAALLHGPVQTRRPADRSIIGFMTAALIVVSAATGGTIWFASTEPEPLPAIVNYRIGRTTLTVPRDWLRAPRPDAPQIDRLELILNWPHNTPSSSAVHTMTKPHPLDGSVLISLSAADALSAPYERLNRLYARFLEPTPETGPAGLTGYSFRTGSRYENEHLFVTSQGFSTANGETFYARCPAARTDAPGSPSADLCTTTLHIGMLDAVVRFGPSRLSDWPRLVDGVTHIVATMMREPLPRP